jgi:hypothetical protein
LRGFCYTLLKIARLGRRSRKLEAIRVFAD